MFELNRDSDKVNEYLKMTGSRVYDENDMIQLILYLNKETLIGESSSYAPINFRNTSFFLRDTSMISPLRMVICPPSPRTYLAIKFRLTRWE